MLALGLNIVVGYAGLLDLGYVAFFALGAYTLGWFGSGLFSRRRSTSWTRTHPQLPGIHLSFWVVVLLAGASARSPASSSAGRPCACAATTSRSSRSASARSSRTSSKRAGADIAPVHQPHERNVRGVGAARPAGVRRDDQRRDGRDPARTATGSLELKPWYFTDPRHVLITVFVNLRLRDSKMGRAWIAVREDEVAASAMGVPLMRTKLWAYAIGAVFGGFAGAVYGSFIGGIFPTSFSFQISVIVLVMVVVGGMGNIWGVIAARCSLVARTSPASTRSASGSTGDRPGRDDVRSIAKYKFGIFGALLVMMMLFRPEGLIPSARRKAEFAEGEGGRRSTT